MLIVDFDMPDAQEAIRMAALLPPAQKPFLLAISSRAWPGTGQAFQSGASRILYKPLEAEPLKEALLAGRKAQKKNRRKSERYEVKTLVYLELESGTLARNQYRYRRTRACGASHRGGADEFERGFPLRVARNGYHNPRACRRDLGQRSGPGGAVLLEARSCGAQASEALADQTGRPPQACRSRLAAAGRR